VTVTDRGILLADVTPTVLDLLHLPVPAQLDGVSQAGCWSNRGCTGRSAWSAYAASVGRREITGVALFAPPFKRISQSAPRSGCFDIVTDPWETANLAVGYTRDPSTVPLQISRISAELDRKRTTLQEALLLSPATSSEDLQMLRDLGYVD
jgi:arylsulfatase A-like enzyme